MTRTTLGTCNGCGFGASVPYTHDLKPGSPVVVLTEAEYQQLVEVICIEDEHSGDNDRREWTSGGTWLHPGEALATIKKPVAPWLLGVKPSSSPTQANPA